MQISGNIVDPLAKRMFYGTLLVGDSGRIEKIEESGSVEQSGPFIIPGFVDAHVHVESSMLIPSEFARLAVCHGTVGTVSDPHEIGNVLGLPGIHFMIENARKVPFKFCFGAPSCVPATPFETAGSAIGVEDVRTLLEMNEIGYLAEVMDFPGVINRDEIPMAKIEAARKVGKPIDGHAPGVRGRDAEKYAEAGISTDHECFTREEALDKIGAGMKILIREGSAAKNFDALISLLDEFPEKIMFCSDDKHPNDLVAGHIDRLAHRAVDYGCDPMNVIRACSLNVVKHYGLGIGLLQENDPADFAVVDNLSDFRVQQTYINGTKVSENGTTFIDRVLEEPINRFNRSTIRLSDIEVPAERETVNIIEVTDGQLMTRRVEGRPNLENGKLVSCVENDFLKIVVVNRYGETRPSVGFVKNFGLKMGAIASSVAHDSHNIIAVGVSDRDLLNAINALIDCRGGIAISSRNDSSLLELPVAGIMTNRCGYETARDYEKLDELAKQNLGSTLSAPFMTLSFCALLVIPELKLGDQGLFDGNQFKFRSLFDI